MVATQREDLWSPREALVDQVNLWVCPGGDRNGQEALPEGTTATRFEQVEPQT